MNSPNNHEVTFIKSFVVKDRQERFLALVQSKKNRNKFRLLLAHNIELKKEKKLFIKKEEDNKEQIYKLLKQNGSPDTCHIICESSNYDNKEMDLKEAINELFSMNFGYIISCIPGKLAYYQGEDTSHKAILLS